MSEAIRGPRLHRPAASATWEHDHKWGRQFGDSTTLYVTRSDGGLLRVAYGSDNVEIRRELVEIFAEMVAAAAAWSDPHPGGARPEGSGSGGGDSDGE